MIFWKRKQKKIDNPYYTRIMINKGMVNKGKYWILEKNKGVPVSFWKILKGFF